MKALEEKVVRVQDVIKETVQFSDKTYFMEETRKIRLEKIRTEKERDIVKEKLREAKRKIKEIEGGN